MYTPSFGLSPPTPKHDHRHTSQRSIIPHVYLRMVYFNAKDIDECSTRIREEKPVKRRQKGALSLSSMRRQYKML